MFECVSIRERMRKGSSWGREWENDEVAREDDDDGDWRLGDDSGMECV